MTGFVERLATWPAQAGGLILVPRLGLSCSNIAGDASCGR